MNTKKGVKKFGTSAIEALFTEFYKIVKMKVFETIDPHTLTKQQKREAIKALSLIKLKRNLKIKGRGVADGRHKRQKYTKTQTYSATCHQDTIMMSLLIDEMERRSIGT